MASMLCKSRAASGVYVLPLGLCGENRRGCLVHQAMPTPRQPINGPKSLLTEPTPVIHFYQQTRQASALRSTLKFGGFLFSSLLSSRGGQL